MLRRVLLGTLVIGLVCGICFTFPVGGREWADATGKFKVEAELVAVRSGKVFLERRDGSVISVPLDKLSAADQEFLKSKEAPAEKTPASVPAAVNPFATPAPTVPAPAPVTANGAELASQAEKVLRANCYRCHGEDGTSEGGFNFVLNLEKLARTVVKPRNAKDSLLYERISTKDESVMPPEGETPRPAASDIALVKAWIDAGAPALAAEKPRDFISNDTIVKHILADVRAASERSRRFMRYFTLTHLYNAGVSKTSCKRIATPSPSSSTACRGTRAW
jgi:mono/diheme cytochrome c family protein